MTLSSQNVQNGTSIRLTAVFDPPIGNANFDDLSCGYTKPDGTGFTLLAKYNSHSSRLRVEVNSALSQSLQARLNVSAATNPMMLDISSITFGDEKRQFYCTLDYFDASLNIVPLESQRDILENVYSK